MAVESWKNVENQKSIPKLHRYNVFKNPFCKTKNHKNNYNFKEPKNRTALGVVKFDKSVTLREVTFKVFLKMNHHRI